MCHEVPERSPHSGALKEGQNKGPALEVPVYFCVQVAPRLRNSERKHFLSSVAAIRSNAAGILSRKSRPALPVPVVLLVPVASSVYSA